MDKIRKTGYQLTNRFPVFCLTADKKPFGCFFTGDTGNPDVFVIIASGQTRTIPIPVSYEGDRFGAFDAEYKIEKGVLYDVAVQVDPYFGTFRKETAAKTLTDFNIPNYRHKTIKANTMTIRMR